MDEEVTVGIHLLAVTISDGNQGKEGTGRRALAEQDDLSLHLRVQSNLVTQTLNHLQLTLRTHGRWEHTAGWKKVGKDLPSGKCLFKS